MVQMQLIDLQAQQAQLTPDGRSIRQSVDDRISSVLDHGKFILGPEVDELEQRLSEYVESDYCVAVASGTDALLIALMALDVHSGDEVITTPFSFISTAETIALLGAVPVFVDIDPFNYNLDHTKIEAAITSKTKAILPVSLYGQPANFSAINDLAKHYSLPVIEDAAQSFGSKHNGKFSCNLSTIGTTSFFPSKPLGCYGDGGACFTNNPTLANRMRIISRHGQSKRYYHTDIGINGRMDTLQAAILLAKLEVFDNEVELRRKVGARYMALLDLVPECATPKVSSMNTSVFAQFTIELDNRSLIQNRLKGMGIPTAIHYPTLLSLQPALQNRIRKNQVERLTPYAFAASNRVLSLPMHPYLSLADQKCIVEAVSLAVS